MISPAPSLFGGRADLGTWLRALPPELNGALTFHLPLEVEALEYVQAGRKVIAERIEERLPEAFGSGLVDPPLYRWAEQSYQDVANDLLSADPAVRLHAFNAVEPLGAGLAGAAFHGLIRLGYGSLRRDREEIDRGLAYMRTRRQVLFSPGIEREEGTPRLPGPDDLDGSSIFHQLDLVAGSPGILGRADTTGPMPTVAEMAHEALRLLFKNPGSFVAVHAVDSLHALVEFHRLLCDEIPAAGLADGLLAGWWRSYLWALRACSTLVDAGGPLTLGHRPPSYATVDRLTDAAIELGCEAHDIKVVVALRRLAEMGVLDEGAVLEAGAAKLAASGVQ
jgi:hypothetical protein